MKALKTTNGHWFSIDDGDYEAVIRFNWHMNKNGYIQSTYTGNIGLAVFLMGKPMSGFVVDHINGDRSNNCRYNLRICSNRENLQNKHKYKDTVGVYKGVTFIRKRVLNPWQARIGKVALGCYFTKEEAALAYNKAAIAKYGEFASLNEIDWNVEQYKMAMSCFEWKNKILSRFISCV